MANSPATAVRPAAKPAVKKTASAGKDNYAAYAAVLAVVLLIFSLGLYFLLHSKTDVGNRQQYEDLPQVIVQSDSDLVRMKLTLEIGEDDQDWLKKNRAAIILIVDQATIDVDPATFRSPAGCVGMQKKLRDAINKQLGADKIREVLYRDLLVQSKAEQ